MEVKQGYKQTEVGVIPEAWKVKSMDSMQAETRQLLGSDVSPIRSDDGVLYIQATQRSGGDRVMTSTASNALEVVPRSKTEVMT